MEFTGNNGIEAILGGNDDIDYVAYVITPWHATALTAAVKKLENDLKKKLYGLAVVMPHVVSGVLLDEAYFSGLNARVLRYQNDEGRIRRIRRTVKGIVYYMTLKKGRADRPFYIFMPVNVSLSDMARADHIYKHGRNVISVNIDEGVGTYLLSEREWLRLNLSESAGLGRKLVVALGYVKSRLFNSGKLKRLGHYLDCNLLIKTEDGSCVANGEMPQWFRRVVDESAECVDVKADVGDSKYIIINTQPTYNYKPEEREELNRILGQCMDVIRESGYRAIVKPHPREDDIDIYRQMGAEILQYKEIAQEVLLAAMDSKPAYIVGFDSTTLVSANVLFGIRTISILNIFMKTEYAGESERKRFEGFKKAFGEFVDCAEDITDFQRMIM